MYFIGVDHHKQFAVMTVLDQEGRELKTGRVPNLKASVDRFVESFRPFTAVIEAGRSSYVMADVLRELGGEVKMANAFQVKAIAHARIKTDKRDSGTLAHLLRTNLIPEVYQREEVNRRRQRVIRMRAFWVRKKTEVMNKIRALLAQQREEVRVEMERRKERLFSIRGLAFLDQLVLPSEDKAVLDDLIKGYRELRDHIQMTDSAVEEVYEAMEEAARIDTVPGFGKTLAVVMAVEIADIRRFQRVEEFHSYAGLVPSTHSSGDRTFHGPITKQGNVWLRWAALEAAYPAIKKDLSLRHLYSRLAKRKGPNVAKIAVARRLLTIVYRLLTEKRDYVVEMKNITAA